jgi:hypothetical protein
MEKNKVVFYCLFFLFAIIPVYPVVANDGYCVRATSEYYVGVREKGGNNNGFTSRELQREMTKAGWRPGYAWCSFFVKAVLDACGVQNSITGWSPSAYNRKDVIYTDGRFKKSFSNGDVLIFTLSYQKFLGKRYKGIGHTGVVDWVGKYSVRTIEGNTNDQGMRDSRTGDGVYIKIRPLNSSLHITRWGK